MLPCTLYVQNCMTAKHVMSRDHSLTSQAMGIADCASVVSSRFLKIENSQ